jgi:hypothetical protein
VAAAATLLLAGCGSSSGSRDSQTTKGRAYVEAMVTGSGPVGNSGFTESQSRCIAAKVVDIIGVEEMEKAGVTPENIDEGDSLTGKYTPTDAEAEDLVDAVLGCVDFGVIFAEQAATDISLPGDKLHCIGDAMAELKEFRTYMKQAIMGLHTGSTVPQSALMYGLVGIFQKCGVDLGALGS